MLSVAVHAARKGADGGWTSPVNEGTKSHCRWDGIVESEEEAVSQSCGAIRMGPSR